MNSNEPWISALKFDPQGLIPAIVQEDLTHEVLMLAYMSRESLRITLAEGYTCFFSRSRNCLWRKGETSGNTQKVVSVTADCDGDTLLVRVKRTGPACHTGAESCFFDRGFAQEETPPFSLSGLLSVIQDRKIHPKDGSYTTYLFEKGREKILKKVGEECTEVLIAGAKGDKKETIFEIGDLTYHVLTLMAEMDISLEDVLRELAGRHVVDHKVKQETMR